MARHASIPSQAEIGLGAGKGKVEYCVGVLLDERPTTKGTRYSVLRLAYGVLSTEYAAYTLYPGSLGVYPGSLPWEIIYGVLGRYCRIPTRYA